jgi:hypothetical protein
MFIINHHLQMMIISISERCSTILDILLNDTSVNYQITNINYIDSITLFGQPINKISLLRGSLLVDQVIYTAPNSSLLDSFSYSVKDTNLATSNLATVYINVINLAPQAFDVLNLIFIGIHQLL